MDIVEKIKKIKYSRLSTEEKHLINVFDNMVEYKTSLYPNNTYYTLDGKLILEINPDTYIYMLYDVWKGADKDKSPIKYSYDGIHRFVDEPGFIETQHLIRCMINKYLGLDNYFPVPISGIRWKINNIVYDDGSLRKD